MRLTRLVTWDRASHMHSYRFREKAAPIGPIVGSRSWARLSEASLARCSTRHAALALPRPSHKNCQKPMSNITADQILAWIERYATRIAEEKDYLTKLDSDIGDADHGSNMHRGFQAVLAKKSELQGKDIGALLKIVAMTLISNVGGAAGALYGTFFLQASAVAGTRTELSPNEFLYILEKGLAGIVLRGKAAIGDKTMVDALQPAIKAYKHSVDSGETLEQALSKAVG